MIGHMLNDLAKAIRRWTEKKSMEEIQMARPSKVAKTEPTSLHQLLWDDPPALTYPMPIWVSTVSARSRASGHSLCTGSEMPFRTCQGLQLKVFRPDFHTS